jgi:hypothetical protein
VNPDTVQGSAIAIIPRYREVDGIGNHVGEAEPFERRLVRYDRYIGPCGQPRGDDILPDGRGIVTDSIKATPDPDKASALGEMGQQRPAKATSAPLPRRKVATLLAGDLEEAGMVGGSDCWMGKLRYCVMHNLHDT